jgi:NAD(P)-dependent dehydrogenase (short-subunit alcohol dehydrogenase family)
LEDFENNPTLLEKELEKAFRVNVIGLINTINAFLPLIKAGSIKKVIGISSGMGDCEFVNESGIDIGIPYSISKAGVNMVIAKYNATYKSEGILFMGICAGSVDTTVKTSETRKCIT